MRYPLTRTVAALTGAYNAVALARPGALVTGMQGQVTRAESVLLARTWAGRDLPLVALVLSGHPGAVGVATGLRVAADLTDATVLGLRTQGAPRRKALGVTLGWAAVTGLAYALDRRRG